MELNSHAENIYAQMNRSLFEWVIENICKNAVDAMKGQGAIRINIVKESEKYVFIDISDTGKGMEKKMFTKVFNPGFTTRQRGWGLGLTLAKRIIEGYHSGRIFVNASELGKGTTFRIVLLGVRDSEE
jgi:signal transduction histidine kinase